MFLPLFKFANEIIGKENISPLFSIHRSFRLFKKIGYIVIRNALEK